MTVQVVTPKPLFAPRVPVAPDHERLKGWPGREPVWTPKRELWKPPDFGSALGGFTQALDFNNSPFSAPEKEKEAPLYSAGEIPFKDKRYLSELIMLSGPRGEGKTVSAVALAYMQLQAMLVAGFPWKVAANFQAAFAEPGLCSPFLIDSMIKLPPWLRALTFVIDETQNAFPNRRSLAKESLEFSIFLTQIRKLGVSGILTTQFPQVIDFHVLIQTTLFIRCKSHADGRIGQYFVFDYWGQFTGNDRRRPFPPRIGEHDWEFWIIGLDNMWDQFNTDEAIGAMMSGAAQREMIAARSGWEFEEEGTEGEPQERHVPEGLAQRPYTLFLSKLHGESGPWKLASYVGEAKQVIEGIGTIGDFADWLPAAGFEVYKDGRVTMARRKKEYDEQVKEKPTP